MPSPRFLVIGAGSRGRTYARCTLAATNGVIAAVAEPDAFKRRQFGEAFIWGPGAEPAAGQAFCSWTDFISYEMDRRRRQLVDPSSVPADIDGVFVCVLDEMHREVVVGLTPLGLHIMCEKPLATTLQDCIDMYKALRTGDQQRQIVSIGHVLRYSPHNIVLRQLLRERRVIGNVLSVVHTEPVGWWHFTHSYVRGNWRRQDTSAPSLLTKSCHDIDLLLWLLCSPVKAGGGKPHLPSTVVSTGKLRHFRRAHKPAEAGSATNCLKCPLADDGCIFSAKNIYLGPKLQGIGSGNRDWPVAIVAPEVRAMDNLADRAAAVTAELALDYDETTPPSKIKSRNWFGRCVFEADNDVCDEQIVTIEWEDDEDEDTSDKTGLVSATKRLAKTATFHMVAQTDKICQRYSHFYGSHGEIYADSAEIRVTDFRTGETQVLTPTIEDAGHGGGDLGLARQFVGAVDAVKNGGWSVKKAQTEYVNCSLDEILRSHALVFAAEEARMQKKVVDWEKWWFMEVDSAM
ncbi:hypothetical protein TD95_001086 [Thielaviopsis punctulata]|uniref:Gfo/Idh/MocA-like oxidoreductase N-terminal domain-containing protein n=1 Tax=Thielaviopsis punctulata TaxID=72032 RepID=A0A0F4ZJ39_9PEZI|nr:hypothetical protein TD95_001086 [Thielaviopsis punctulata]